MEFRILSFFQINLLSEFSRIINNICDILKKIYTIRNIYNFGAKFMCDLETLVVKQIFKSQTSPVGKVIEYSGLELACLILDENVINAKYRGLITDKKNANIVPYFERKDDCLSGEEWRQHEKTKLWVSNFGRVKAPDGILLEQTDKNKKVGYLQLKNWKEIETRYMFKFDKLEYVYQLVAETWLEKDEEGQKEHWNEKWEVHHISNNGYDNRPENLIWLKRKIHKKIHNEKIKSL